MIKEKIKNFNSYSIDNDDYKINLDKNENPFDVPKKLKKKIIKELEKIPFNRYPPIICNDLRKKIADYLGFKTENIVLGNGSDQLIDNILDLFKRNKIIINTPTFEMYSFYARKKGLDVIDIPLDKNFQLQQVWELDNDVNIIFICSPNSPTGNIISREKIIKTLETNNIVVLDEAYVEFAEKDNLDMIKEYDNLVILRTFSKAFGLAGIRFGYAITNKNFADNLVKTMSPYNINSFTLKIAEKMIDNYDLIEKRVKYIIKERNRLKKTFEKYAYPSSTNFVLLDLDAYNYLLDRGIKVRRFNGRLSNKVRITIGNKNENQEVIDTLKDYIKKKE